MRIASSALVKQDLTKYLDNCQRGYGSNISQNVNRHFGKVRAAEPSAAAAPAAPGPELEVEGCDGTVDQLIEINAPMARTGSNKRFVSRGGPRQFGRNRLRPDPRIAPPNAPRFATTTCVNGNGKGHRAHECPEPRKSMAERRCFSCDKVGHTRRSVRSRSVFQ